MEGTISMAATNHGPFGFLFFFRCRNCCPTITASASATSFSSMFWPFKSGRCRRRARGGDGAFIVVFIGASVDFD